MTRRKTALVEDLLAIVVKLPWWLGLVLALVSYLLLHKLAAQPVASSAQQGQLGALVVRSVGQTLASYGQYIVPMLCLIGAAVSAWKRAHRIQLVSHATSGDASSAIDGMRWREFEVLVGEGFRLQGYRVVETGGGGADGGVDLVLSRPGQSGSEKYLVQCKQWRAYKVGVDVVRQLYGVMAARGAAGGYVVTSGRFTTEAVNFASGRNLNLIDGPKLHRLIAQAKAGAGRSAAAPLQARTAAVPPSAVPATSCPLCAQPMVLRTAKRGATAGIRFWGCAGYPACRGTRPIA